MAIESINPTTGNRIQVYGEATHSEVRAIIDGVQSSQRDWANLSFAERATPLRRAATLLRDRKRTLAALMANEMGKPVAQGESEAEKCAWVCDFYAENAEAFLTRELIATDASKSYVTFRPLGILLAVMPWNFPLWQVFRAVAPALMAGNAVVLKHASNVPGCALAIEELFVEARLPAGLFRTLLVSSRSVDKIIEHPAVSAVTLTGSTLAGKAVASIAGAMLKKCVLELGGSDAYVILEDADLAAASATCATSRLINGGQSCIAAKRFVVLESVREEFEHLMVKEMSAHVMGNPLDPNVTIGPMARQDLRDELHHQVMRSVELGAKVLLGGTIPDAPGAFYPPTILSNVQKGMPAYDEETFGPVAAIISAKDEADAIRIANDSVFGLGGAVFTRDVRRGERIAAEELEAGSCFVNAFVKSDPRLPFGGIKESGFGRELSSFGIREFVNIKTVFVK